MKIFVFLALFVSLSAHAQSNPQIRVCNVTEGLFHVYDFPNTTDFAADQYGFCIFGNSSVDTISLLQVTAGEEKSMAILAFERTKVLPATDCSEASYQIGVDPEGGRIEACLYEDFSVIEFNTLLLGYDAVENKDLVKAIETRF